MKNVFREVPYGIEHTLRVLDYAEQIMNEENIDQADQEQIAITAILHDIGAIEAQKKYGPWEQNIRKKKDRRLRVKYSRALVMMLRE
jgi:HD superfamily phosphodiesterase